MKKTQNIIGIVIIIFCVLFLALILEGCTTNQFEGEQNITANIIDTKRGNLLIKYNLGNILLHDEVEIENLALLTDLLRSGQTANFRLIIKGHDSCTIRFSSLTYYYGSTKLGESTIYEYQDIYDIVKKQPDLVKWTWMDGKQITNNEDKIEEVRKNENKPL